MTDKKAFVFDTNFIIQYHNLDEIEDSLNGKFSVYITQISIDERIAQKNHEIKIQFDDAEKCSAEFSHFVTVKFKKTYEQECEYFKAGMQRKYENCFGNHIIPFAKDEEMFTTIIDRANKRLPPFSAAKDASDKGFKDCILWLSMLAYFKNNGEDLVIFVTDDKSGFRNNKEFLENEFYEVTGKNIEIKPNSYYKELIKQSEDSNQEQEHLNQELISEIKNEEFPNLNTLREEIEETVEGLRGVEWEDYFGDYHWSQTFTVSVPFDKEYTKRFFEELRENISDHILENSISASKILEFDDRISNCDKEIPMQNVEKLLRLYQRVLSNYSQYKEQFFEASAKILNRNYKPSFKSSLDVNDEGGLPF